MPDISSSKRNEINDGYWLRRYAASNGIPADCVRAYQILFNQGVAHNKKLIDDIIRLQGGSITVPMQAQYLEEYLSGFTFEYRTFSNLETGDVETEGFWRYDPTNPSNIIISYNHNTNRRRQRYSQIHELMHFVQTVDPRFLKFFDDLILNSTLPENVIAKLLHRMTERATAMYLMPNDYFLKKYHEIQARTGVFNDANLRELANHFDVSYQTAKYRLNECLRPAPPFINPLGVMPP